APRPPVARAEEVTRGATVDRRVIGRGLAEEVDADGLASLRFAERNKGKLGNKQAKEEDRKRNRQTCRSVFAARRQSLIKPIYDD
ncbi:hypothetical protein HAX54_035721, partial [Datura stramonium]|nr:hypothetical protein [Datura stramonium]